MKKLLSSMALAAVMAVSFAQTTTTNQTQTTTIVNPNGSITTYMTTNNLGWEEAASAMAIARAYNMDPAMVYSTRGTVSAPFYTLAPAYMIASQSGKPFSDVYQMYNNGMTWLQIANQFNVPATYYNPTNVATDNWSNDDFTKWAWDAMLAKNYGLTADDFTYFNTQNVPMNELVVGEILANEYHQPIRDVISAYNTNKDWPTVQRSWSTTTTTTTTPNARPANQTPITDTTTTTTTSTLTLPATKPEDVIPGDHHTQTAQAPIEDWQVSGANVQGYMTGQSESSSSTSTFTMRRHHRHHRHYRHHRRNHKN